MAAVVGSIERLGETVVESVRIRLFEKTGMTRGWRGSFALDLGSDPDAGDWVTQIKSDPNDPGFKLTLTDGRVGTFHVTSHIRRSALMHVEFEGSGPLVNPS